MSTTSEPTVQPDPLEFTPTPVRTFSVRVWISRVLWLGLRFDFPDLNHGQYSYARTIDEGLSIMRSRFAVIVQDCDWRGTSLPWRSERRPRPLFHEERWITVEVPSEGRGSWDREHHRHRGASDDQDDRGKDDQ